MKILMLGWELPPHNSGGLGVACLQLAKALASSGADIEFVLPYYSDQQYDFMKVTAATPARAVDFDHINVYDSHMYKIAGGRAAAGLNEHQYAYELGVGRISEEVQFDVIHAHDWLTFRAALRAKELSKTPLIVHVHSTEHDRAGGKYGNPLVREIEATTMLLADHVVTVSQRVKDIIVKDYAIPEDKIEVVYNSVDKNYFEPLDEANAYRYLEDMKASGWRVVANVGRLTIQKGLPHLLRAAARVVEREPKTFFVLVGSGEQRDELIELAAELGIADRVLFVGFQRGKRWRDAYAVADLFIMPSVSEPFGLTPLEAIAYGTPALISKQSGVAEVLQNCLKVDFWDEHEMANQIVSVIQNPALAGELHANSWHEYEKMSWTRAADQLMDLYRAHQRGVLV